jgi:hypothetical protein
MFNILSRFLFSFITGIVSGFFALLFLGAVQLTLTSIGTEDLISRFFINEIGEELVKILFILFILNLLVSDKKDWALGIFYSILIGFGFSFFEVILIALSGGITETLGLLLILGIHSLTAFILGIAALSWQLNKKWFIPFVFLVIAIGIHIVYNLFALNFYK